MILRRDGYELCDDPGRIDLDATWTFLRTAYWSPNVPREVVARAIAALTVLATEDAHGLYQRFGSSTDELSDGQA